MHSSSQAGAQAGVQATAGENVRPAAGAEPRHVAIIMDGNGRWAEAQGKRRVSGHRAGVETVRRIVSRASEMELASLTLYAFSSENWRRPEEEVTLLMELFMAVLTREVKKLHRNNVRLRIIGDVSGFSERLQKQIHKAEQLTADNSGLNLNVAANYGGRWDITQAARRLAQQVADGTLTPEQITEQHMDNYVCMADQPEVDLMIRTGGDHRISNYLLWQSAYAELCFVPQFWPDFTADEFTALVRSFGDRERRFGATGAQVRAGQAPVSGKMTATGQAGSAYAANKPESVSPSVPSGEL